MIDRNFSFSEFREDVKLALLDVAKKYNVVIDPGKIRYSDIEFSLQLNVTEKVNGAEDAGEATWSYYCTLYGFDRDDYGKIITIKNKQYKICGIDHNAKCSILTKDLKNNSTVGWVPFAVKDALENLKRGE